MAAPAAILKIHPSPFAAADHARFFISWLRRIAPDTHQDQASGDDAACRPGGSAAPEERWCRTASNGLTQTRGYRCFGANPVLARAAGDPHHCKSVTATVSNSDHLASVPVRFRGLPCAVVTQAKQRVTSNGLRSFSMWKHARASLCASALMATTLFVFAFFRS